MQDNPAESEAPDLLRAERRTALGCAEIKPGRLNLSGAVLLSVHQPDTGPSPPDAPPCQPVAPPGFQLIHPNEWKLGPTNVS